MARVNGQVMERALAVHIRDVTEFESESNCCKIPTIFLQIQNPMNLQISRLIRIQLSFWKAHVHHLSQSGVSHTKANRCTLNSYLLTSVQTKH